MDELLSKYRTLGRRLLAELMSGKEGPSPHQRPQPRSSEIALTPTDYGRVIGKDDRAVAPGTIARPTHGGHVHRVHKTYPVLESLLELIRDYTVESCAHRFRSRGRPHTDAPATTAQPHDGRVNDGISEFTAEVRDRQYPNPATKHRRSR